MANKEHLAILKQGVEVWNEWRRANSTGFFLSPPAVDLSKSNLREISLSGANLRKADLHRAYLNGADLSGADLYSVNLYGADLYSADLSKANLCWTQLGRANLTMATLKGANLREAQLGGTIFAGVDLSQVSGLKEVDHPHRSYIDIHTLVKSKGKIPESFLRGIGAPDTFIEYLPSLTGEAIQYYSCFISYASQDNEFAERLHADLQDKGVRCWFAPHDQRIGEPIIRGIDEAIRVHEKTLLILSEHSVSSRWVEQEVEMASAKELQGSEPTTALFPIRIDEAVMQTNVMWADTIRRTRHIGDFTRWKDHDSYRAAFDRLLRDLKGEASG